jgi:hypothetical protein
MRGALASVACLLLAAPYANAEPLPTRDQNPLVSSFGLPMPLASRVDATPGWTARMDVNWGSTALLQDSDDDVLLVDVETFEARWTLQRSLNDRVAVQLQVPWRHVGAGTLDGFIDEWHDVFGLPEGARPVLPRDELNIAYQSDGALVLNVDESSSGIGDISAAVAYELLATTDAAASVWLSLKVPTGDAQKLTGSGTVDWSVVLAADRRIGNRWNAFGQAGLTRLGTGELLASRQEDWIWSALAGLGWQAWGGVELKAQIDAHTATYDAEGLDYFGEAVILTVGGSYRSGGGWQFDAGVSEDLAVEGSPDVVFIFGLRRSW